MFGRPEEKAPETPEKQKSEAQPPSPLSAGSGSGLWTDQCIALELLLRASCSFASSHDHKGR